MNPAPDTSGPTPDTRHPTPSVLTNMTFWQSAEWLERTDSIYPLTPGGGDPQFIPWWKEVWTLFRKSHGYDVVVTMGVRESFTFAALCCLTGRRICHVMTEVFIDAPKTSSPLWRLKTWWYRTLAGRAAGIITNSSAEVVTNAERFGLPESRFTYVPLNTTIDDPVRCDEAPEGYAFCAGRTLRDYETLKAVIDTVPGKWIVVAGADDLAGETLPDRVTVHREIDRERYLELLRGARVVVLPLLPTGRATGQVVVLEAMSYGKPVITTDAPGTRDIVRDGENGFLVQPSDPAAILDRISQLNADHELARSVGEAAIEDVRTVFSTTNHARNRIKAIEDFWSRWNSGS